MSPSHLTDLSKIIADGIAKIESAYTDHGTSYPTLDDPFAPPPFDDSALLEASALVISAASQLVASLRPPGLSLFEAAGSVSFSPS